MSISFDAAYSATATGDSVLFDATVAQTDSIMLFFNSNKVGYGLYASATIRYNSVDATYIGSITTGNNEVGAWYLVNPDTGTHQVSQAFSSNFDKCGAVAIYKNARQSSQPDAYSTDSSASEATKNLAVTVVTDNSWIVGAWAMASGTPSSGTTERIAQADGGSGLTLFVGDSNSSKSAGSQSLEYTGSAQEWAGIIVSIAPNVFRSKIISFNEAYI